MEQHKGRLVCLLSTISRNSPRFLKPGVWSERVRPAIGDKYWRPHDRVWLPLVWDDKNGVSVSNPDMPIVIRKAANDYERSLPRIVRSGRWRKASSLQVHRPHGQGLSVILRRSGLREDRANLGGDAGSFEAGPRMEGASDAFRENSPRNV